ncbi:MAG: response regulator transcription factor [Solirubrobacteraceae bacterium]
MTPRGRTASQVLTRAEQVVAALAPDGLSNHAIAERLVISRATVKTHLAHIFAKLGVKNRTELAVAVRTSSPRQKDDRD